MENKKTLAQINQEYSQVATLYGDRLFKITMLQEEVKGLFQKMATLNMEAGQAQGLVLMPTPPQPQAVQPSPAEAPKPEEAPAPAAAQESK